MKFMKKVVFASMVLWAWIGAMAQTEKTRGFDDLYHYIENLDVFEYGQEESRA